MWKLINVNSTDYLVNFDFDAEHSYLKILISNFEHLWSAEFDKDNLVDTFKKFNPLIELDKMTLVKEIEGLFTGVKTEASWDMKYTDTILQLKVKSTLGGVPFRFEIDFHQINNKIIFQTIVLPLLILVKNLQKQNEYLCSVIKKKDMEITEYKFDGAVLSRKTVETPLFDETSLGHTFDEDLKTIACNNFGTLLNEALSSQLDKIKSTVCKKPAETIVVKNISSESEKLNVSIQEPPKKKFIKSILKTEGKIENVKELEVPAVIKKKPKNAKRLVNL